MRLAAALTVVVGVVVGYALLPALRPAPKAISTTLRNGVASGTPSVPTGAPAVVEEESAGALLDYPQIPGRGGVSTAPPSPTIARPAPTASRTPKARASSRPSARVASAGGHHAVSGVATFYCCTKGYSAGSPTAAAGPALRAALGSHWRGRWVRVTAGSNVVVVHVVDWCQCGSGRVIDLHPGAFDDLAPLSRGVVPVRVSW